MSLQTRLASLITAIGADIKALNAKFPADGFLGIIKDSGGTWPTQPSTKGICRWTGSIAPPAGANDVTPYYIRDNDEAINTNDSIVPNVTWPGITYIPGAITATGTHTFVSQLIPSAPEGSLFFIVLFVPSNITDQDYVLTVSNGSAVIPQIGTPIRGTNFHLRLYATRYYAYMENKSITAQAVNAAGANITTASVTAQICGMFITDLVDTTPLVQTQGAIVTGTTNVSPSASSAAQVLEIGVQAGYGSTAGAAYFDTDAPMTKTISKTRAASSTPWPFISVGVNLTPVTGTFGSRTFRTFISGPTDPISMTSAITTLGFKTKTGLTTRKVRVNGAWVTPTS